MHLPTGFLCFLGYAEFTVRSHRADAECLKVRDIEICQDNSMFTPFFAESKTDPFRRGTTVLYFQNDTLCPVSCMKSYPEIVRRESFYSNAPLFVDFNIKPFSRENFISNLRDILRRLGYNENHYSGESLRVGAATQACSIGIEGNLIQTLGRWNSSGYTLIKCSNFTNSLSEKTTNGIPLKFSQSHFKTSFIGWFSQIVARIYKSIM